MQKSTGPKNDLCGSSYLTVPSDEEEPWIKTRCTLFLRYEQKKGREFKSTESSESKILWSTRSNAFLKSE